MVELEFDYKTGRRTLREEMLHALQQLRGNVFNRAWWYFEFTNRVVPILSRETQKPSPKAIEIGKQEWDNLIILDACRFDAFSVKLRQHKQLISNIDYSLTNYESLGTCTPEFLFSNFDGKRFPDVVYVSCNPYVSTILPKGTFFKVVDAWSDNWDANFHTVLPYNAAKIALRTKHEFPDKRLIVHFMQPHTPFIGRRRPPGESFWDIALHKGTAMAREAYMDNLDEVLPYALALFVSLGGQTVLTSDHGEAWGERVPSLGVPIFAHPYRVHIPVLTDIPWMVTRVDKGSLQKESGYLKAMIRLARLRAGIR
jgi:hypothetical protein